MHIDQNDMGQVEMHLGNALYVLEFEGPNAPDLNWDPLDREGLPLTSAGGPNRPFAYALCNAEQSEL